MDQVQATTPPLKLNAENWVIWKFQTSVILKGRGLFDIVTGDKPKPTEAAELAKWLKDDAKAQEYLVTRIDQGPLTHLLSCNSSKEMWSKLKSIYDKESVVSVHLLQQKFFLMAFGNDSVSSYISQLEEIKNKLKQAGEELSEKMVMTKILMSLPERYKHFRSAWESVPVENQTLDELTSRLLIEEERATSSEGTTALASSSVVENKNTYQKGGKSKCHICHKSGHSAKNCFKKGENHKADMKKCAYCKKMGHLITECWFRKNKEEKQKNDSEPGTNAFVGTSEKLSANDWCMDTGASEHMCWKKELFENLVEMQVNKKVKIGDGNTLDVKGIGKVVLFAFNGQQLIKTILSGVLYVPGLKFNLFSVGCALDKGYSMISNSDKCELIDKNGKVRAVAKRRNKLYKMDFVQENDGTHSNQINVLCVAECESERTCNDIIDSDVDISDCHVVETVENIHVWHERLAHQNINHVKQILTRNNIKYIESNTKFVCEKCLAGKQHRMPHPSSSSRATERLALVHADVCGPMETVSLGGARYFLLLKDDFSSYRYVFFMKCKSEVKKYIEKFISLAERETNCKMKVLRTDNGLEFINHEITEMLEVKGIRHQKSVTYTPQQNGRAEREMRTLVEAARTMIQGMNKYFWAEAINAATYTINRTGTSIIKDKSPYEVWYEKQIDLNTFKTFGSRVSVHIPKEKRLKWDVKNNEGIFIGYSEEVKGFRIYFPRKNRVECHRDVIFLPERKSEPILVETHEQDVENEYISEVETESQANSDNETENQVNHESNEDSSDEEPEGRYNLRQTRKQPSKLDDYETSFLTLYEDEDPKTYEEAVSSNESSKWEEAIQEEISALEENQTWLCGENPGENKVIECKWVFKRKKNENGSVVKYKARLVAKGFQQSGMSFSDVYSPVAKLPSIRIFLALCNNLKIPIFQLDVCSAFLNGDIKGDVYISLPGGFHEKQGTICKLRKSLYGLKSSPKNWNEKFHEVMLSLSFLRSEYEYCLYIKVTKTCKLYILLYVDDVLLAGTREEEVESIKITLRNHFKMKDLGLVSHFLGMVISQDLSKGKITINQTSYLKNVLTKFKMQNCKPITTPMDINFKHGVLKREKSESLEIETECRMLIGSLMYAMLCSRPDICVSISILSRYQSCASQELWQALKRVLRYIQGTIHLSLVYNTFDNGGNCIEGFADSDWAGDTVDRKSTAGYIFKFFGCTVSWASRKQSTVALSSTEAEYVALSLAVSEACWLRYLIKYLEIQDQYVCVKLFEDNQSAIKVSKNPEFHKRLKHVDIRFHFIRDKIKENVVCLEYLNTSEQIADLFTKPLGIALFKNFCKKLGLE